MSIALDVLDAPAPDVFAETRATRFHLDICSEQWGLYFCHDGRASSIRVTDVPAVRDRDDHRLLANTPPLKAIDILIRDLERRNRIEFQRRHAAIQSDIDGSASLSAVKAWVALL